MGDVEPMGRGMGRITRGIAPGQIQRRTIDFVYANLSGWRDDPLRPTAESENDLNASLCKYLQLQASDLFPMVQFFHQESQGKRHSVDLSASPTSPMEFGGRLFTAYNPLLLMEGKRLPPPEKSREREYVSGGVDGSGKPTASGGIQRFKLGLHGAEYDVAVMLGYIQKDSPVDWHSRVNDWIVELAGKESPDGCIWTVADKLRPQIVNDNLSTSRSESLHERTSVPNGNSVQLHHLWIKM